MTAQEFAGKINDIWTKTKTGKLRDRQARFAVIERLVDEYIAKNGKRPEPEQLDRLATLCLYEEITDDTPWKVRNTERPILSDRQKEEIRRNEVTTKIPNKHRKPTRRKRSTYENIVMDRAKSKNKKRRWQYREFTQVQPVKRWNMYSGDVYDD